MSYPPPRITSMEVVARDPQALLDRIEDEHTRLCAASAGLLEAIGALDEAEPWPDDPEVSLQSSLASRFAVSSATASEWVRVARALRSLPAIRAAHAAGQLSWDQLRPLSRFATAETDAELAAWARPIGARRLYDEARRHERERRKNFESDRQMRYLRMWWDEDRRFLNLEGSLPAEQGARVEAALERRAEEIVLEEGPLYDRHGARLADALEELLSSSGDRLAPATLVVHADTEVVAGQPSSGRVHLAETEWGTQLSNEAVRRLACDARIEWVLESEGRTVGVGRRGRVVPGWLMRQLRYRDRTCRAPGCERTRWLHAHHIRHWADGGGTDLENLELLCGTHHRRGHDGEGKASGPPARDVNRQVWTEPLRTAPFPPRPGLWPRPAPMRN
jgi:hypothetical protein